MPRNALKRIVPEMYLEVVGDARDLAVNVNKALFENVLLVKSEDTLQVDYNI